MKPDFICIGAFKCATTWLYVRLSTHREFWMPPVKEISYFNNRPTYLDQLRGKDWYLRAPRKQLTKRLGLSLRGQMKTNELWWYGRFVLTPRSDAWYSSLFKPARELITGDITPAYAILELGQIEHVKLLLPNVKIIYLLRNPIDRDWSAFLHRQVRGKNKTNSWKEEIAEGRFPSQYDISSSNYLSNLRAWKNYFSEDQIFVGFFDDLKADGGAFLAKIVQFLRGSRNVTKLPPNVNRVIHRGLGLPIPQDVELFLSRMHLKALIELDSVFPNAAPAQWLSRAFAVCEQRIKPG